MTDSVVPTEPSVRNNSIPRILVVAAAAVAVAVLVTAVGLGVWLWNLPDNRTADARDSALDGARQAAINLNSLNSDDVAGSVALMESSTTGDMHDQIEEHRDQVAQLAAQSKARLEATVLNAALTELNTDEDTAKALVVVVQTSTYPDQQPTRQRLTWTMNMHEIDGVWKAEQATTLGQPVILDTPSVPAPAPAPAPTPEATEGGGS